VSHDCSQFSPNPGSPGKRRIARRGHLLEMLSPPQLLRPRQIQHQLLQEAADTNPFTQE
jgi:hypothetical protein